MEIQVKANKDKNVTVGKIVAIIDNKEKELALYEIAEMMFNEALKNKEALLIGKKDKELRLFKDENGELQIDIYRKHRNVVHYCYTDKSTLIILIKDVII